MRIELNGFDGAFRSAGDLERIIPINRIGKALNYGQGEGQIQIDDSVWGIYLGRKRQYFVQYEEGSMTPVEFQALWTDIIDHLSSNFTTSITIDGIHEGDPNI